MSKNPAQIMIDIETLGTKPGAIVTRIAACAFYLEGETFKSSDEFEIGIDIGSWNDNFHINPDTLKPTINTNTQINISTFICCASTKITLQSQPHTYLTIFR